MYPTCLPCAACGKDLSALLNELDGWYEEFLRYGIYCAECAKALPLRPPYYEGLVYPASRPEEHVRGLYPEGYDTLTSGEWAPADGVRHRMLWQKHPLPDDVPVIWRGRGLAFTGLCTGCLGIYAVTWGGFHLDPLRLLETPCERVPRYYVRPS